MDLGGGPSAQGEQVCLAQLTHNAIDVNGDEPQGIRKDEVAERAFEKLHSGSLGCSTNTDLPGRNP
jgi:hypothetical protein